MNRLVLFSFLLFTACDFSSNQNEDIGFSRAYSNIDSSSFYWRSDARIKHLDLSIQVDFDSLILRGVAGYNIDRNGDSTIHFDIRDIEITTVYINDDRDFKKLTSAEYMIHEGNELGNDLEVKINEYTATVHIVYKTKTNSRALQWLKPEQTHDKISPYMYTQGFAIETRTWIPIQDSPGIRVSYQATIKTPLNASAVMSGNSVQRLKEKGRYEFMQKKPVPPYLIALAVGTIRSTPIGKRNEVYAEKGQLISASNELDNMEEMMQIAEKLYGKYRWNNYNVLVMPPSFPLGGMENPQISFLSPTIIAGDKSLISTLAHELAHSWSGNLVTNATWNDFWLNEGFTVYIENRIMEEINGLEYARLKDVLQFQQLENSLSRLDPKDCKLKLEIGNRNPEVAMTDIAYLKGYFFLKAIENEVGRPKMDAFLKDYFNHFSFQSISTEEFLDYLKEKLLVGSDDTIDINTWVYDSTIPPSFSIAKSSRYEVVQQQLLKVANNEPLDTIDMNEWNSIEWKLFLNQASASIDMEQIQFLDQHFQLTGIKNAEIATAWYVLAISHDYTHVDPYVERFLLKVGRNKYLQALYGAYINHSEEGKQKAKAIYIKARPMYHHVSTQSLDVLLMEKIQLGA